MNKGTSKDRLMSRNNQKQQALASSSDPVAMCFIVGRWPDEAEPWEIQGIYDNEEVAKKACLGRCWFVMPAPRNTPLPTASSVAGYYPNE